MALPWEFDSPEEYQAALALEEYAREIGASELKAQLRETKAAAVADMATGKGRTVVAKNNGHVATQMTAQAAAQAVTPTPAAPTGQDALMAEIERLRAENAVLQNAQASKYRTAIQVSAKRAVSVYGFGRFPITLYAPSMLALLDKADEIRAFIEKHRSELSWAKEDKAAN